MGRAPPGLLIALTAPALPAPGEDGGAGSSWLRPQTPMPRRKLAWYGTRFLQALRAGRRQGLCPRRYERTLQAEASSSAIREIRSFGILDTGALTLTAATIFSV